MYEFPHWSHIISILSGHLRFVNNSELLRFQQIVPIYRCSHQTFSVHEFKKTIITLQNVCVCASVFNFLLTVPHHLLTSFSSAHGTEETMDGYSVCARLCARAIREKGSVWDRGKRNDLLETHERGKTRKKVAKHFGLALKIEEHASTTKVNR